MIITVCAAGARNPAVIHRGWEVVHHFHHSCKEFIGVLSDGEEDFHTFTTDDSADVVPAWSRWEKILSRQECAPRALLSLDETVVTYFATKNGLKDGVHFNTTLQHYWWTLKLSICKRHLMTGVSSIVVHDSTAFTVIARWSLSSLIM